MNLMRAIAQYYATLPGMTVPAERFTEGHRGQLDKLPAITYQRTGTPRQNHQKGPGLVVASVQFTVWGETPAQAGRIADQLADKFDWLTYTDIGSDPDTVSLILCRLDTQTDSTDYPRDESADFSSNSTLYFEFLYMAAQPSTIP